MQTTDPDPTDEEDEFVRLFIEHQIVLRAFVISLLPGCQDVDDIIQDVSMAIWKNRARYESNTNFKAWIFALARFRVLSFWRDSQRNKESALPEDLMDLLVSESDENIQLDVIKDQVGALRHCLANLRQEDRGLDRGHRSEVARRRARRGGGAGARDARQPPAAHRYSDARETPRRDAEARDLD